MNTGRVGYRVGRWIWHEHVDKGEIGEYVMCSWIQQGWWVQKEQKDSRETGGYKVDGWDTRRVWGQQEGHIDIESTSEYQMGR